MRNKNGITAKGGRLMAANSENCPERKSFDGKGWAQFKVVHWDKMKAAGFSIKALDYRRIA